MRFPLIPLAFLVAAAPQAAQDNVLIVVVDDIGIDQLASYGLGLDLPPTPNIDALAGRGVLFRNAYSNPVCSPTRAQILTGRHGFRTGIGHIVGPGLSEPNFFSLPLDETTLPEMLDLGTAGLWDHAAIGKWHLHEGPGFETAPNDAGFDHFAGTPANLGFDPAGYYNWIKVVDGSFAPVVDTYATTDQVDETVAFVSTATEPWMCYLAFSAAHAPFHAPPLTLHTQDLSGAGDPLTNPRPYYKATVEALDTELGRLFSSMGTMLDRTNVVFLADNGTPFEVVQPPFDPEHAKVTLYDGGCHVPMIVSGPAVAQPGTESDALVSATDVFATVAEFASVNTTQILPSGVLLDSISLVPYLDDPSTPSLRETVYSEIFGPIGTGPYDIEGYTVRGERYKLIRVFTPGVPGYAVEFYDLRNDPHEQMDLLVAGPTAAELDEYRRLDRVARDLNRPAQITGPAGSEDFVVLGSNTDAGGGLGASPSYRIASQVGHSVAGTTDSSGHSSSGGVTWLTGGIATDHPVTFGFDIAKGSPSGGESRQLFGFGLNELGTTTVLDLELGGVDVAGLTVVSDTVAQVVTPPGINQFSNPAGVESLWLHTDDGQFVATHAFAYLPALDILSPTRVGGVLELRVAVQPGNSYLLFFGSAIPGTALTVSPFSGQLELLAHFQVLTPPATSPGGEERLTVPIPPDPTTVGLAVDFQGLAGLVSDPSSASWTNRVRAVLAPSL